MDQSSESEAGSGGPTYPPGATTYPAGASMGMMGKQGARARGSRQGSVAKVLALSREQSNAHLLCQDSM